MPFYHGLHGDRGRATILIFSLISPEPRRAKLFHRQSDKKVNTRRGGNPPA